MPLPFLLLFRFNPKQGCAPRTTVVRSQKSTRVLMNDHMCFVCNLVKLRVHTGNDQRQPEGTMLTKPPPQTVSPSAERSRSDFTQAPLSVPTVSDPASVTLQPHLAPSNSHTYHIHSGPPHPPRDGNSYAVFPKSGYSVTEKSPVWKNSVSVTSGSAFRIFTASPKRSSQH